MCVLPGVPLLDVVDTAVDGSSSELVCRHTRARTTALHTLSHGQGRAAPSNHVQTPQPFESRLVYICVTTAVAIIILTLLQDKIYLLVQNG